MPETYRLYSWEHSYFSGKARAYLRFKDEQGALGPGYEDILATPDLIAGLLNPRSGSGAIPQLEAPDGTWIQDSSDIIDWCERTHAEAPVVPDARSAPRQRLCAYLLEFLADEWIVVPAFWQRWFFSEDGREPSHRHFNEQQWGAVLGAGADAEARRAAGAAFFDQGFGIHSSRSEPKGVYAGLIHLGCDEKTERAWQASQHEILRKLERHFAVHDYVLGGRPSLADYGLLGPLYAHLYRDAVPGFAMRVFFPITCEWVERANGEGALNARRYGQKLYSLGDSGELVPRVASSDAGEWLPGDGIADTLRPLIGTFFEEMAPTLRSAGEALRRYLDSDAHSEGDEVPGKTFTATPGFIELQTGDGALTHEFEIGGVRSRRMVVPYQFWMWQRMIDALEPALADPQARRSLEEFLAPYEGGRDLLDLSSVLGPWRLRKQGALLTSERR